MENLGFGLQLTLVGMALVFGVLALLWGLLAILGRLDGDAPDVAAISVEAEAAPAVEPALLSAITVAVILHAQARRRQAAPETRSTVPGSQIYASRWLAAGRTRQTRGWQRTR